MIKINLAKPALIKGDCIEVLKLLPDKSVDLILTDPPYGVTGCKWDSIVPFKEMWGELRRIVKNERSAIVLFGSEPFSSNLRMSNIKEFRYDWYWKKSTPSNYLDAKNRPMGVFEVASVFSQKPSFYYPQDLVRIDKMVSLPNKKNNSMFDSSNKERITKVQEFTNYPRNFLEYKKDGKLHTSQKPVALLEYLVKTYSQPGEVVLDFTMGSGSTGVACMNTGRSFVGIERDDKYFEVCQSRLNA